MYQRKHLLFVGPGTFFDPVKTQRLGCAATALIQRRDEARVRFYFLQLLFVDSERFHNASFSSRYCLIRLSAELPSANLLTESSRRLVSRIIVKSSRMAMTRIRAGETSAATSASTTAHCSRDRQLHRRRMLQSTPRPKARSTPLPGRWPRNLDREDPGQRHQSRYDRNGRSGLRRFQRRRMGSPSANICRGWRR